MNVEPRYLLNTSNDRICEYFSRVDFVLELLGTGTLENMHAECSARNKYEAALLLIEKHFFLDRSLWGPDADFSLTHNEFATMTAAVREAEKALGEVTYELSDKVKENRKFARSPFVVKDIKKGEKITEENVRSIRPGYGMHPKYLSFVVNKCVKVNVIKGEPLNWIMIEV